MKYQKPKAGVWYCPEYQIIYNVFRSSGKIWVEFGDGNVFEVLGIPLSAIYLGKL